MALYFEQADLEIAVGGSAVLVRLLDKDGDGLADADKVLAVRTQSCAEADTALQVAIDLAALTAPFPPSLVYFSARVGAYYAHLVGTDGQGVPPGVRQVYEDARTWLDQVARGERSLGIESHPSAQLDTGQVDPDPNGVRVTRDSMKGFA